MSVELKSIRFAFSVLTRIMKDTQFDFQKKKKKKKKTKMGKQRLSSCLNYEHTTVGNADLSEQSRAKWKSIK